MLIQTITKEQMSPSFSQPSNTSETPDYNNFYTKISSGERDYPCFRNWFFNTVVNNIENGSRKILIEYSNNQIAAIAIIKNTTIEKKLCNLTVLDGYKNRGIGIRLIKRSFKELGTEKPFFTISENKLQEFEKIIHYFGFCEGRPVSGLYRTGKTEYLYNEYLN